MKTRSWFGSRCTITLQTSRLSTSNLLSLLVKLETKQVVLLMELLQTCKTPKPPRRSTPLRISWVIARTQNRATVATRKTTIAWKKDSSTSSTVEESWRHHQQPVVTRIPLLRAHRSQTWKRECKTHIVRLSSLTGAMGVKWTASQLLLIMLTMPSFRHLKALIYITANPW